MIVNVIYQDKRNVALMDARVELTGGYTEEHIPLRLAVTDRWGAVPEDFKVIRVLPVTGDAARDEAALLDAHAEILDADALKLRAILDDPAQAPTLTDVGIDRAWITEHFEDEADRLRSRALQLTY